MNVLSSRARSLTLSNEVYRSREGVCYEGRGIPVEVELPQFTNDGADPTLDWLLANAPACTGPSLGGGMRD